MKEPDFYYGKGPKKYYDWIRYIEQYFSAKALEADINDHAKVVYAATFLKGDLESAWERHTENVSPETMTWSDYKTWLHDRLENPIHREWTAVMKLEDLHPSLPLLQFLMILEFRLLPILEMMSDTGSFQNYDRSYVKRFKTSQQCRRG